MGDIFLAKEARAVSLRKHGVKQRMWLFFDGFRFSRNVSIKPISKPIFCVDGEVIYGRVLTGLYHGDISFSV